MAKKVSKQAVKRNLAITRRVMSENAHDYHNHDLNRVHRDDEEHTFPMITADENETLERFAERLSWMDDLANVYVEEGDGQISFFTASPQQPEMLVHVDVNFHGEFLGDLLDRLYELPEGEYAEYLISAERQVYLSGVAVFLEAPAEV